MPLELCPVTLAEANAFVDAHHRHRAAVVGHKFSVAVSLNGQVVGVAIVGRPVNRHLDDGVTLEVVRCCTVGAKNACSKLYGACWRAAKAMGYSRLTTYILDSEVGSTMAAVGWRLVGEVKGRSWDCNARPRVDLYPQQDKLRFEVGDRYAG